LIEISLHTAIVIYLTIGLALLFTLWIKDNKERSRKIRPTPLFQLYICEYCRFPYLDETDRPVTRCPQCQAMNKDNYYTKQNLH